VSDGFIGNAQVVVPDIAGRALGVRGFGRVGHFLASPFQGDAWRGPERRAVCQPDRSATAAALAATGTKSKTARSVAQRIVERQQARPDHDPPGDSCPCGLYAYHSPDLFTDHQAVHPVVAAVHAWGVIVVHPGGFRASDMRVVALALPDDLGDGIAGERLAEAARRAAAWWRLPLLGLDELRANWREFGDPIPDELFPYEQKETGK
jgi:hypothetical protein